MNDIWLFESVFITAIHVDFEIFLRCKEGKCHAFAWHSYYGLGRAGFVGQSFTTITSRSSPRTAGFSVRGFSQGDSLLKSSSYLYFPKYLARISFLSTLPIAVTGSASKNLISRGRLKSASLSRQNSINSSAVADRPSRRTIKAATSSPSFGCGLPTTAHCPTAGCS